MSTVTTKCVNGLLQAGDLVISIPSDSFEFLIGRVLKINLLGSPEHEAETANGTDDIHVGFMDFEYSAERIQEIEKMLFDLYGKKLDYCDAPLDDTIMPPGSLIRITGIDEKRLLELLKSERNTIYYCFEVMSESLTQAQTNSESSDESSEVKNHILEVIDRALPLAGYKVMDSNRDSIVVRHSASDSDFEIKVVPLA